MHNDALLEQLKSNLAHVDLKKVKLSRDIAYVAKSQAVPLPFLPVHTPQEKKLYTLLTLEHLRVTRRSAPDFNTVALEWCKHVNGETIFPKIPVYLRTYNDTYMYNQRVRQAISSSRESAGRLSDLNRATAATMPDSPNLVQAKRSGPVAVVDQLPSNSDSNNHENGSIPASFVMVGGISLSSISNTAVPKKRGRPPNRTSENSPRHCLNCKFFDDIERAGACPARHSGGVCVKAELHAEFIKARDKKKSKTLMPPV